jgi:mycobactin salicyl-AMP ligase
LSAVPDDVLDWPRNDGAPVVTGAALFQQRAERRGEELALLDAEDRSECGLRPGRGFSYAQAARAVEGLCGFFADHGLEPGEVVALQTPNVAEAVLIVLAAWRRGLTVAMLPVLWREMEIAEACALIQPAALIGAGEILGESVTNGLREAAAMHFSVRLVAGFGGELPDGVASLDQIIAGDAETGFETSAPYPSHAPALITFTARQGHAMLPVPLMADELFAQGAMTVTALRLEPGDRILNPFPLSNMVGLGLGLMPWLIAGGALLQHQPFSYAGFVQQMLDSRATVTALPPPFLHALVEDEALRGRNARLRRLGRVIHPGTSPKAPDLSGRHGIDLFDVHPLGDIACVIVERPAHGDAALLPRGKLHFDGAGNDGTVFAETALSKSLDAETGELLLRGAVVPKSAPAPLNPDARGFVGSGLRCLPEEASEPLLRLKPDAELIHHGGFSIATAELDALYRGLPGAADAAAFSLPDPILGEAIHAAVVPKPDQSASLVAMEWYLKKRQAAPFKYPQAVHVVARIPRDGSGRILREALKQMATKPED